MQSFSSFVEHVYSEEKLYNLLISPIYEKHGLTFMEFTVIMFLANNPQYDTATDLVKYRHLTKSHVSITLSSLEKKKLISREYRPENHRTVHIKLSDKTNPIVIDGRNVQQKFANMLIDGFTDNELKVLKSYLKRIHDNVDDSLEIQKSGTK